MKSGANASKTMGQISKNGGAKWSKQWGKCAKNDGANLQRASNTQSYHGARPARPRRACGGGLERDAREENRGRE